jgi:hypothetical protein
VSRAAAALPGGGGAVAVPWTDRHAPGTKDIYRAGSGRVTLAREQGEGRDPKLVARECQKEVAR